MTPEKLIAKQSLDYINALDKLINTLDFTDKSSIGIVTECTNINKAIQSLLLKIVERVGIES